MIYSMIYRADSAAVVRSDIGQQQLRSSIHLQFGKESTHFTALIRGASHLAVNYSK